MLPWDYNLSFGGFQSGDASPTVNFPIDTPFTSSLSDRQFFASLLENREYLAKYHSYLKKLSDQYVDGGEFAKTASRIRGQIDTLVKTDPTAFYTNKEYKAEVTMLETVVKLRAKSVEGQLVGTISSTTDGQSKNSTSLVDSSAVNLSVMGTMMGGKGGNGGPGQNNQKAGTTNSTTNSKSGTQEQKSADSSGTSGGGTPPTGKNRGNPGKSASSSKTDSTKKSA